MSLPGAIGTPFTRKFKVRDNGDVMCQCGWEEPMLPEKGKLLGKPTTYIWYRCQGCGGITQDLPVPIVAG